jgi:DNA recombination protein RmuC
VREHIRALGAKEYWAQIETTPEFVVLFMPGDHLLGAALDSDPELMDFGIKMKVVLATPTTVIALLWAVVYGWKQEYLQNNVRKIGALGSDLYSALSSMTKHFVDLGGKLSGGVKAYNDALGSFERNVLGKARRLRDYGVTKDGKSLPDEIEPIDLQLRALEPPEETANEDAA